MNIPLSFEVNRGQTAPQVKYLARSREGTLFFTNNGVTVAAPRTGAFRMLFENAAQPAIVPEQQMIARSNYLARHDGQPITNVENYATVRYSGLYPGIDVRFYGQGRHLEHDFVLAPGADPVQIVLRYEGLDRLALNQAGNAELVLGELTLTETQPVAWQIVNGAKRAVSARWKLLSENRLGIELGSYDRSLAVTIDPVLVYSTHLGGATGNDPDIGTTFPADTFVTHIGLDSHRNVYVAGQTSAIDYPTTAGAFDRTNHDQCEFHAGCLSESGFVSKFDPTGRILIYSTFLRVSVEAMAVDLAGHVYSAEAQAIEDPGPDDGQTDEGIHVDKLSLDGSQLIFTTMFATSNGPPCAVTNFQNSFPRGMAADSTGHVWLVGNTGNPCIGTPGTFQSKLPNTNNSGFLARFDTTKTPSTALMFATYLAGTSGNGTFAVAVGFDSSANVYVAGNTAGTSFPHGVGFGTGQNSVFVAKLNATGSSLLFGTLLHSGSVDSLAIDSSHNIYVAGQAVVGFPTTTGAFRRTPSGMNCKDVNSNPTPCPDGFVTKLSPGGGTMLYSTFLGGSNVDNITGLALNSAGMAFVTGVTTSTDFPVTASAFQKTMPAGADNAFVTALQPDGKSLVYSTYLGGSHGTQGFAIAVDPAWNAWVAGNTSDSDFPVTANAFQPGKEGNSDGFFAKVVIAADLGATLAENTTLVARNGTVSYTERVNNFGPDGSDAVVLTDAIPSGFSFAGIVSTTATSCSVPALGATSGSVVCHKTRLESGQSFTVVLKLKAIAASGSHLTNKITVSARTQDLKPANNTAQVVVVVQ
ncbi:MAG TPA: SBBP repeat-containing protein [Candidatus Angelobacter sp.]|nr:SBBP repeat-containing protein [Candidatus Angelobacter sp.]